MYYANYNPLSNMWEVMNSKGNFVFRSSSDSMIVSFICNLLDNGYNVNVEGVVY